MAYSTLTDLEKSIPEAQIIQLTDDESAGAVNEDVVDEAIAWADDLIDNHARGKYPVPITPVPEMVKKISVDLVIFWLYTRRQAYEIPDGVQTRYNAAMRLLEKIQRGTIVLEAETGDVDTSEMRTNKTEDDRIFNQDVLDTF